MPLLRHEGIQFTLTGDEPVIETYVSGHRGNSCSGKVLRETEGGGSSRKVAMQYGLHIAKVEQLLLELPARTRTHNLQITNLPLYPIELRKQERLPCGSPAKGEPKWQIGSYNP